MKCRPSGFYPACLRSLLLFLAVIPCAAGELATPCTDCVAGSLGCGDSFTGALEPSDCELDDGSYADSFVLEVAEDSVLSIRMTSPDFDTFLILSHSDCSLIEYNTGAPDTRLTVWIRAGEYFVVANSFAAGETGAYTIEVSCEPRPDDGTPCSRVVNEVTCGGSSRSYLEPGESEGIRLEVAEDSTVSIRLRPFSFDGHLDLRNRRCGFVERMGADCGNFNESCITAWLPAGEYFLFAHSAGPDQEGGYDLNVTCEATPFDIAPPEFTEPATHRLEAAWSARRLSVGLNVGGLFFDPSGDVLYVVGGANLDSFGQLHAIPVHRDETTRQVLDLGPAAAVSSAFRGSATRLDVGWAVGPEGTLFYNYYSFLSNRLAQRPGGVRGDETTFDMSAIGISPSITGVTFSPLRSDPLTGFGWLQVSVFGDGRILDVPLEPLGGGLFEPQAPDVFCQVTDGVGAFSYIPSGPRRGDVIYTDWSRDSLFVLDIDPSSGLPIDDADGEPRLGTSTPRVSLLASGLEGVYGLTFDPLTNDLFVTTWAGAPTDAILRISGFGPRDCNENGVFDSEDIAGATSHDCDGNGVPDECQTDCDQNGVLDVCDLRDGTATDCDRNGVPDSCDPDSDGDGTPDACEVSFLRGDCDGDGRLPGAVNDAVANFQHCFRGRDVPCRAACDTDGDGNPCSGVTDGLRILLYVFQNGDPPPGPFPECGASARPEDDKLGCERSGCRL